MKKSKEKSISFRDLGTLLKKCGAPRPGRFDDWEESVRESFQQLLDKIESPENNTDSKGDSDEKDN